MVYWLWLSTSTELYALPTKLHGAIIQKTTILSSWLWNLKHQDINCMKYCSRVVLESSYSLYNRAFTYNLSTIMLYAVVVSTLCMLHTSTMSSIFPVLRCKGWVVTDLFLIDFVWSQVFLFLFSLFHTFYIPIYSQFYKDF